MPSSCCQRAPQLGACIQSIGGYHQAAEYQVWSLRRSDHKTLGCYSLNTWHAMLQEGRRRGGAYGKNSHSFYLLR